MAVILYARLALDERHGEVTELTEYIGDRADEREPRIVRRIAEPLLSDQAEQQHRKCAADGTAEAARPGLVRTDVRRHLTLPEPHPEVHGQRVAREGDEERREDINSAEVRIAPQQKDAAIHRRKSHAADDSGTERGKRKRPLSAEAMHGGEKQQHQKRPTQYRHGLDRAEKCPLAVIQKHLIRRGRCDREQIYARRHILPRRVQQLIGRNAGDGAHEQHGRPRRTRQQYQQQ